jgi:transcriptional regulator GlxA family with amidase domain
VTVARSPQVVVARRGPRIVPDATLADGPPFDVPVVAGGVVDAVSSDTEVTGPVARRHATSRLTLSVCAGAFILGEAGLLEGRPATTHWSDEDELERRWPSVQVQREPRWVDDGHLITSAGISAGIDARVHVLRRLFASQLAELTAYRMEYAWHDLPRSA